MLIYPHELGKMDKRKFKECLFDLLKKYVNVNDNMYDEKMNFVYNSIIEFEKENEDLRDTSNKGKSWTDEELKIILSDAPTKLNCLKYAKIFNRGYGSIEQIYRWSSYPMSKVPDERKKDSFICQIKKVGQELGKV